MGIVLCKYISTGIEAGSWRVQAICWPMPMISGTRMICRANFEERQNPHLLLPSHASGALQSTPCTECCRPLCSKTIYECMQSYLCNPVVPTHNCPLPPMVRHLEKAKLGADYLLVQRL